MRLAKTDTVAGILAPVVRRFLRRVGHLSISKWYAVEILEEMGVQDAAQGIDRMVEDDLLEVVRRSDHGDALELTLKGSAVAMASFGKPITRATADRLVSGLLVRARAYNADEGKPMFVRRLRVFGSYLDPEADRLGDVDIELGLERRLGVPDQDFVDYGRRSGRNFPSYFQQVTWPHTEACQILANRSVALNITMQDIDHITDRSKIIFEAEQERPS